MEEEGQGCERQSSACPPPHAGGVGVCCSWAILSLPAQAPHLHGPLALDPWGREGQ